MKLNMFFWFLAFLCIILLFLVIQGILYNYVSNQPINLNPVPGKAEQQVECSKNVVQCYDDGDCQEKCTESSSGEQMKCVSIQRYTGDQIQNYGQSQQVCLPSYPDIECGQKYGGLLTWSGWSNPDRMEWDCLCSYPEYASNENCTKLNPNICGGDANKNNFKWDATQGVAPDQKYCTCPDGKAKIISRHGLLPLCVPNQDIQFYGDLSSNIIPQDLKEGDLFSCPREAPYFRYSNFEKRPIPSEEIGISWDPNYNTDKLKRTLTQDQCDQIPTGPPLHIKILDRTLFTCRANTGSENPSVNDIFYYDDDTETRRYVQSPDIGKSTVKDWKNWTNYVQPNINCGSLPRGEDMTFQYDGRTIFCNDVNKVFNRYSNGTIRRYGTDTGQRFDDIVKSAQIAKECDPSLKNVDINNIINIDNCSVFRVGEDITDASKCPK